MGRRAARRNDDGASASGGAVKSTGTRRSLLKYRDQVWKRRCRDVKQLKRLAKPLRGTTPVDYYIVFQELESQLADEFDFIREAAAMERIGTTLSEAPGGAALVVPKTIPSLCSKRVLVMDYLSGEPLSRLAERLPEV